MTEILRAARRVAPICRTMLVIPITYVDDVLTLNQLLEISRFRYRCPALTGLHCGAPMLAFEPRNFDATAPPDIYELPVQLTRLAIVGLDPDWNQRLLDTACDVGRWATEAKSHRADTRCLRLPADQASPPAICGAPQPRLPLRKIFRRMQETNTAVAGFAVTKKKRRPESASVILVQGAQETDEIRSRLGLHEHATITFL